MDPRDGIMLQTEFNDRCDKLSELGGTVNLVDRRRFQFITLFELCLQRVLTIDMPKQKLSKSGVWDKVPAGLLLFLDTV